MLEDPPKGPLKLGKRDLLFSLFDGLYRNGLFSVLGLHPKNESHKKQKTSGV